MENRLLLLLISLLFFISCSEKTTHDTEAPDNLEVYNNKFVRSKKVGWLKMDLFLKPTSLFVSRFVKQNPGDTLGLKEVKEDANEMMYFDLRLSVTEGEGKHIENYGLTSKFEQDQRIQYLAFSMKNDIYLTQGEQVIPCEVFHFERNYSISPHRTFIVGFPRSKLLDKQDVTFVFDSQHLQTGPLKIQYTSKTIFDSTQIEI